MSITVLKTYNFRNQNLEHKNDEINTNKGNYSPVFNIILEGITIIKQISSSRTGSETFWNWRTKIGLDL